MEAVITTSQIVRRFGDLTAVDGLTFEVFRGEIFGFLGHNGAGKTTTVRLLNGVLTVDEGEAQVLGLNPVEDGPALRCRTGILTENPSLDERLTARENLRFFAELYNVPRENVTRRIEALFELFELAERADERVGGYSKGMKQRLALARALLHGPELIFLDEPTAGLDPVAARRVRELIARMSREENRTVFICTHNLAEAQRLCHRVAVLEKGKLLALGTPPELAKKLGQRLGLEIEVEPADLHTALETIRRVTGKDDLQSEIDQVVVPGIAHRAIPDLIGALSAAGVRVYRVTPQEPSLEDIYFALHDEANFHNTEEHVS